MKKKYIIYKKNGKTYKSVLDESLFKHLQLDPTVEELMEYDNEMLMEKRYAERLGVTDNRKTLLG